MTLPADNSELDSAPFPTEDLNNDFLDDDDDLNGSFSRKALTMRRERPSESWIQIPRVITFTKDLVGLR